MDPRFYQKIEIFEIENFNNFIVYYFFLIFLAFFAFCFLFHVSYLVQKLWNFLCCFIGRVTDFYQRFLENSTSSFKKNIDMWNIFFSKILRITICFFIIFDILFSILSTCQKILAIFMFFLFYGIEILSKNFGKSSNVFQKTIHIWSPKFFINFIVLLFVFFFILLAFW